MDEQTKQETDMITKAHHAAERLEKANETNKELIKRMEAFEARQILGGKASAGEPQVRQLSEEEKLKIEMKEFFKGTVIGDVLK